MANEVPVTPRKITGLNRLQLQAACVKLGLDSTAENEKLRQLLQEHWNQHGQSHSQGEVIVNQSEIEANDQTRFGSSKVPSTTDVTVKEETEDDIYAIEGDLDIKKEVKEEVVEVSVTASTLENPFLVQVDVEVKKESDAMIEDTEDATIKQETDANMVVDTKVEDASVPIVQRKQFWETRTSSTRPVLPVSKTRLTTRAATKEQSTSTSKSGVPKRRRSTEDMDTDANVKDEVDQDSNNNLLPTPGTVRKLIGKFAGSAISPPGSPVNKRQKVGASKSPRPATLSAPVTPRYKKVLKIPTAGSAKAKSAYANGTSSGDAGTGLLVRAKRRETGQSAISAADKMSSSPALSTSTSRRPGATKSVSVETINRLAMPKKVSTAPAPAVPMAVSSSSAVPSTPTRPRGPVLSTASRAAQRRQREAK